MQYTISKTLSNKVNKKMNDINDKTKKISNNFNIKKLKGSD